jgi:Family of unknown function (DUF6325)
LTDTSGTDPTNGITADLVGYVIITLPDVDALVTLTPALGELVESGTLRILDFVVVVRGDTPRVLELDALDHVADLQRIRPHMPGLLTQRDITLASVAIPEGAAGVVLVVEDRWAKPLSVAASLAGGQIVAGERISAERIQAAMADDSPD